MTSLTMKVSSVYDMYMRSLTKKCLLSAAKLMMKSDSCETSYTYKIYNNYINIIKRRKDL